MSKKPEPITSFHKAIVITESSVDTGSAYEGHVVLYNNYVLIRKNGYNPENEREIWIPRNKVKKIETPKQ